MTADQDNEMWQRIEDAFSPSVDELRRAEKDLKKVRPEAFEQTSSADTRVGASSSRRVFAMAAMLTLLVAGISWVGAEIRNRDRFDNQTNADLVEVALTSPAAPRWWVSSMSFARKRIKGGLMALQSTAKSESEDAEVIASAQQAWDRLRSGEYRSVGDGNDDIDAMLETIWDNEVPPTEKLRVIDNIEGLVGRMILAVQSSEPVKTDSKDLLIWRIKHYLEDAYKKPPKRDSDK